MNKTTKIVLATLILLVLLEIFFAHGQHAAFWWQKIKGNHALLGILGGIGMMFFAKGLGQFWLYRKEDYYS